MHRVSVGCTFLPSAASEAFPSSGAGFLLAPNTPEKKPPRLHPVPAASQSHPPLSEGPTSGPSRTSEDELDPELLALPDPPKQGFWATVSLLVLTAVASVAMAFALRRDVAYAFASGVPHELGDLSQVHFDQVEGNELVHARAMVGAGGAIRYERPFDSVSYRLAPVVGHPNIWVELQVPAGAETGRFVPSQEFTGRLVPFAKAGPKHRGLARSIHDSTGRVVPDGAWLLAEGERPANARWAVALVLLFGMFAIWNLVTLAKLLRPAKD